MTPLQKAKKLRTDGCITGPLFLQWIWWIDGQLSESEGMFGKDQKLSWKEVKALLKQRFS